METETLNDSIYQVPKPWITCIKEVRVKLFSLLWMLVTYHRIKSLTAVKIGFSCFLSVVRGQTLDCTDKVCANQCSLWGVCMCVCVCLCFQIDCLIICSIIFLEVVLHRIKHIYQ